MRAVRNVAGAVEVVDIDEPAGDGVLVKVTAVGICASDLLYLARGSDQIAGHEIAGVLEDGTPVAVEAIFGCGTCDQCAQGKYNLCALCGIEILGMTKPGGMSEYFRAPQRALVPLPAGLDPADACLVEPGSVAWHGCRVGGVGPDTRVAVIGGGGIGQLAVAAARSLRAGDVALEARHDHQRAVGEAFGASAPSGVYDVVIEAAGSESSLHRAMELVRPEGTIVTIGLHPPETVWPHRQQFLKEVRIAPAIGYCGHDHQREFAEVAGMLATKPEIARALITHRFGIDDAVAAFAAAGVRSAGTLRVVVHP